MIRGKSVALVGSGPGCLDNPHGFVDSHDVVVRVNNYKLMGGTGSRTDIFYSFFGTSIRKSATELTHDGVKACWSRLPDAQFMESAWHKRRGKMTGVDFQYVYRNRDAWWFCPTYVSTLPEFLDKFNLLGGHVPTTGFSAVLDVLSCKPRNLFLTGFDFFQTHVHNVNQRWNEGHPGDPIKHVPEVERQWFAANVEHLPITMDELLSQAVAGHVAPRLTVIKKPVSRFQIRRKRIA